MSEPHAAADPRRRTVVQCEAAASDAPPAGVVLRKPIPFACRAPAVLAFGAYFKNALCLAHDGEALLTETVGDLDTPEACRQAEAAADALQQVTGCRPAAVVHDLHPDFHSSRLAVALAARLGVPAFPVQHHHAHVAAVLAEHGHRGPALGLALDGVGLGTDGSAWGGELLHVDGARFARLGHLRQLPLAGGDRAAREPWRMAAAILHLAGRGEEIAARFRHHPAAAMLAAVLARDGLCPPTSSLGRWFDAAAGLLGVCELMRFEAEAPIALERLATEYAATHGALPAEPDAWQIDADGTLDLLPLLVRLADEPDAARGAARFHATLVAALADWISCAAVHGRFDAPSSGAPADEPVVLSGGCFHNRILAGGLAHALRERGFTVLEALHLSPGDAGLALGQAWVAAHQLNQGA
jgi:hydrogenase maturation protein HypF